MYQFVLAKIASFLEHHEAVISDMDEKNLLAKVKKDLAQFKPINFYHPEAGTQLFDALSLLQDYKIRLVSIHNGLKEKPTPSPALIKSISELDKVLFLLDNKISKLENLQRRIPDGILDVKRALWLKKELSSVKEKDSSLQASLGLLKEHLTKLNREYVALAKTGDSLPNMLWTTSSFYWTQLAVYRDLLKAQADLFEENAAYLTESGNLAARCLMNALKTMPSAKIIDKVLLSIQTTRVNKANFVKAYGFCATMAIDCCRGLQQLKKNFFYLPHDNSRYHFDYNPADDLVGTGGDCFGQSMMLIISLAQGRFKWLCPEAGLLNYQIDQSRPLPAPFVKETLASAETEVSADSEHHSIQWDDLRTLFNEEHFKAGDLCGLTFAQNDYTKAQRSFTAGHIAVVAKLDVERSPYKYLLFEKEFGVFGLADEESLELVVKKIMAMYEGMNYSKVKLTKYGDATDQTYKLMTSFKPVDSLVTTPVSALSLFKVKAGDELIPSPSPGLTAN
ncbi:type IV secretion protein Dot [Legionella sp. km772]|uniref:type IV secretion protein Dot n=1 Tax=Legionella sp. km772 TaxID=2498111 RepID=UPI000F8E303A|nr:type IV secretion protein Dot [Legionella sp. km772]RUR07824.1 type IV secretion protein Dot [Legionella sp. km772]